ncbi:Uma2 family endonuclease [soil metagenome]|jgi:Uma2 family endonuclease|nr:Uma2 family endonuclease [Acidobacteriota bacterium]
MLEQVTTTQYVFCPLADEEKRELYTNEYVKKMARDEFSHYELIGGEIIVSTAPRYIHQLLSMRIAIQFSKYLEKNPIGEILATPGLIFSDYDGVIPDLIFITHERRDEILDETDGKFHGAPELVIEILSPGRVNARRDLSIKRELYEIFGVPEYWVVKPQQKEIEIFQLGKASKIYTENEILKTTFLPKFKLKIEQLFAS